MIQLVERWPERLNLLGHRSTSWITDGLGGFRERNHSWKREKSQHGYVCVADDKTIQHDVLNDFLFEVLRLILVGYQTLGKRLCIKFPWSAILINISTLATSSVPKQPMKSVQPATGLEHFAEGSNCRAFGRKKIGVWAVLSEGDASHITRRRSSQPSTVATTRTGCWRVRDLARASAK